MLLDPAYLTGKVGHNTRQWKTSGAGKKLEGKVDLFSQWLHFNGSSTYAF